MNFREIIFNHLGLYSEKLVEDVKIKNILKQLLPYQTEFQLIRLGDKNDGGYLIPNDLDGIKHCFTAGVGHTCNFEKELFNKFKIISTMIDPIIDKTITLPDNAKFINKKLSGFDNDHSISINNFIDKAGDIILKIDIEGEEYENLLAISEDKLNQARILIIEFHHLRDLRSKFFNQIFSQIINKILKNFIVCHTHVNNGGKVKNLNKIKVPDILEVTFINKKRLSFQPNEFSKIPHPLDRKILKDKPDISIDKSWYEY